MPFPPHLPQQPNETGAAYAQRLQIENTALEHALGTVAGKIADWKFAEPSPLHAWAETCRQNQAMHDARANDAASKINEGRSRT